MLPFKDERFEVIRQLGEGGMSTIYLAVEKSLDRLVAIKLLHPALYQNPKNRERLKREAQAVAKLNNRNIVQIYHYIEEENASYIVMEYINGTTLDKFLEENPVEQIEIGVMLFLEIAKGIAYTHKYKIIHRDIKPENVMISKEGDIKITDFGIASILGEQKSLTTTGSIMGSPMFMSPEHFTDEKVDHQSDIFSLGIIFYNMVTSDLPFKGKNAGQVFHNIIQCKYTHPQQINSAIPNDIANIVVKSLASTKQERYQNIQEMIDDIERYFLSINFDPVKELKRYFKNPEKYQKDLIKIMIGKYIKLAQKNLQTGSFPKAIRYSQIVLSIEPENIEAKKIVERVEKGDKGSKLFVYGSIFLALFIVVISTFSYLKGGSGKNWKVKTIITDIKKIETDLTKSYNAQKGVEKFKFFKKEIEKGGDIIKKMISYQFNKFLNLEIKKDENIDKGDKNRIKNGKLIDKNRINRIKRGRKFSIPIVVFPKAASITLDGKFIGYGGGLKNLDLKTNKKYKLEVFSKGCYNKKETLLYKKIPKNGNIKVRLLWKPAKLIINNEKEGDVFIDNHYKGADKKIVYYQKIDNFNTLGRESVSVKVIKDRKIIYRKKVVLKAGDIVEKTVKF